MVISLSLMLTSEVFGQIMPWQTEQTHIRLLIQESSDQGLHCLQFGVLLFEI